MSTITADATRIQELIPSGQLVTFTLDNVEFGLDIDRVQEITPRSSITPVPGSPSFILGVLNLRGIIIPVLDSRMRFHLAPQEPTARTRIIVLNLAGQPTGLQVDSVAEVVKVDDFTLRPTPPLVAGVRSDYLAGMVSAGNRLITLIDLDKILDSSEFSQRELLVERNAAQAGLGYQAMTSEEEEGVEDERPHVTFALGQESFGINLELVEEILEMPSITKVPDAPSYVMGVICLRDQVLPLLDIFQLLEVQDQAAAHQREMVILLNLGMVKMGIAVDGIQEIMRIREGDVLPHPQTLSEREIERLEGVVVRRDRMVSLLKIMSVLPEEDQAKLMALGTSLTAQLSQAQQVVESHDMPLVVFRLGSESYGLKLHDVREIIMRGLITPVPRAPEFIEGVLNLRGEVMPVIDLRSRFGLESVAATSLSRIIITAIAGVWTGLVVDAVNEVKTIDERKLEEPPRYTSVGANAYIHKVARLQDGVVFLLDLQHLLTDVENQQLSSFQGKKRT